MIPAGLDGGGQWSVVRGRGSGRGDKMVAKSAKDLRVYKKAYSLAMAIFFLSKH